MRVKNLPEPKPFITMKVTSGAMLDDAGQMVIMLSALTVSARTRTVIRPTESPNTPKPTRPIAEERSKVAKSHEASEADAPTELA